MTKDNFKEAKLINATLLLNPTILIAMSTAYIYLCSFLFEAGQCNTLSIPLSFITPSLSLILILAVVSIIYATFLITIAYIIGVLIKPLISDMSTEATLLLGVVFGISSMLAYLIFDIVNLSISRIVWFVLLLIVIIGSFLAFTYYLRFIIWLMDFSEKRKKKSLIKAEDETHVFEENSEKPKETNKKNNYASIIFVVAFYPLIIYSLGVDYIVSQTKFKILTSHPNIVLVKRYDDLLFFKPYSKSKQVNRDSLIIVKLSDKNNIVLKEKALGRLKFN